MPKAKAVSTKKRSPKGLRFLVRLFIRDFENKKTGTNHISGEDAQKGRNGLLGVFFCTFVF